MPQYWQQYQISMHKYWLQKVCFIFYGPELIWLWQLLFSKQKCIAGLIKITYLLMLYSNRFSIIANVKCLCSAEIKDWVFSKRKNQGFSVSHCRQAKPHAPKLHAKAYKSRIHGNQSKEFQRYEKIVSAWLTFGLWTSESRVMEEIWCIPKWREKWFCASHIHIWIGRMHKFLQIDSEICWEPWFYFCVKMESVYLHIFH